jgi:competence protein ComEA
MYALVAVVLAVVAFRWAAEGHDGSPGGGTGTSTAGVVRRPVTTSVPVVHVAGEVQHPGVYRIGGDSRVIQAIRLAGGPTGRANLQGLNLAAPVADGQQILVPARVSAAADGMASASGTRRGPISLSSATAADLEALDGVGPALAARIVEWRQAHGGFSSVDQVDDVPGIGPARLEALRPHLTP